MQTQAYTAPTLTKEQPWNIRNQNQEWKAKIIGPAQKTGTSSHATEAYKIAIEAAKDPEISQVYLNRGYKRATGLDIAPNRRPDVTIVKKDGTVHATEVQSKTDRETILRSRNQEAMNMLPREKQGDINIVHANKKDNFK